MVEFGRLLELKNNGKSLNFQAQKVVAVAYKRWSFTRGSNCKALTGKVFMHWELFFQNRELFPPIAALMFVKFKRTL